MKQYFIFLNKEKQGPYTFSELEKLNINSNSLIWTKGMDDWTKASNIEELNIILENLPPPLPKKDPNQFLLYLKKNFKYIVITFIIGLMIFLYLDDNFFDFMIESSYGGYASENYQSNRPRINNQVRGIRDILMSIALFLGIFSVPIFYLFKKKK